jgi:lipopolysaccharide biosynthesis protein
MPEVREYLGHIPPPFDIFLTTDTEAKVPAIREAFRNWSAGRVEIRTFENRGRDIAPKLLAWPEVYRDYGLMLHIHTKKTDYNSYLERWRTYLFRNLLGSRKTVSDILSLFSGDGRMGMVAPMHHHALNMADPYGANLADMRSLAGRMGIDVGRLRHLDFPAGSMFWARTAALRPLLETGLRHSDFPDELGQKDGTLAHAVERLFLVSCEAAGFRWTKVVCDDNYPETAHGLNIPNEDRLRERLHEQWLHRRMLPGDGKEPVSLTDCQV